MRNKELKKKISEALNFKLTEDNMTNLIDAIEKNQIDNVKVRVHGKELNKNKFEELARPILKYLCENYHPRVSVIITPTSAELVEGLKTIGNVEDYLID
jgi:hypothetical protein